MDRIITEEYIKKSIDYILEQNARLPEQGITLMFSDVRYKSCDIENKIIEYSLSAPFAATNRIGTAHGGYQAGLMDEIMGWTLHIFKATKGYICTTSGMHLEYLKAVPIDKPLTAKVQVRHMGRRSAVTSCELFADGKLCSLATENWAVLDEGSEASSPEKPEGKDAPELFVNMLFTGTRK